MPPGVFGKFEAAKSSSSQPSSALTSVQNAGCTSSDLRRLGPTPMALVDQLVESFLDLNWTNFHLIFNTTAHPKAHVFFFFNPPAVAVQAG